MAYVSSLLRMYLCADTEGDVHPRGFLGQFNKGAIIDEIQRVPEMTSYLQSLIDEDPQYGRWVLTGSQSLTMMEFRAT